MAMMIACLLSGCQDNGRDDAQEAIDKYVFDDAMKEFLLLNSIESEEIKCFVRVALLSDPNIAHAYYTEGNEGEKIINIVREVGGVDDEGSMMETVGVPMLAAATVGAALAKSLSVRDAFGGPNPRRRVETRDEEKNNRRAHTYAYNNNSLKERVASIRSNPLRMNSYKGLATSRAAFYSHSSARGGAYSGSKGG